MNDLISSSSIPKSRVEYLVSSGTESELESNLDQILRWVDEDVVEWKPIGGVVNTDVFGNLTDSMTALVENVTNSTDAYLLQNYTEGTYKNCFEAGDEVLNTEDHRIKMRVDGDKPSGSSDGYSVTFSDSAHGQSHEDFDVFVNPLESGLSKQEYSFLQGCRGVGSITALGHTENGYKFVGSAVDTNPEEWTWTVIRSGEDNGYYYLTINGEFPSFTGTLDCGDGIGEKTHGTVVKLYNYRLPTNPKDAAHGSVFTRELSRYMPEPVVPIDVYDTRYSEDPYEYGGIESILTEYEDLFEIAEVSHDVMAVGTVEATAYVVKTKEERERLADEGVIPEEYVESFNNFFASNTNNAGLVCVNGQTHHAYTRSEIGSLTGLQHISDNMIVVVNLLDNKSTVGESLFNSGRTGFSDTTAKRRIEQAVIERLGSVDSLQEINEDYQDSTTDDTDASNGDTLSSDTDVVSVKRNSSGGIESVSIKDPETEETVTVASDSSNSGEQKEETPDTPETTPDALNEEQIVQAAAESVTLTEDTLEEFLNECFKELVSTYEEDTSRNMEDFQSVASSVGAVFEAYFEYVIETLHKDVTVERDVELEDAAMIGTGSADAVIYASDSKEEIVGIIELKGNPSEYMNKEGEVIHTASCSGLQRSDTVKKAVCQGYQSKTGYPDVPFILVSNTLPSEGTSPDRVLSFAQDDLIDEIVDITKSEDLNALFESL